MTNPDGNIAGNLPTPPSAGLESVAQSSLSTRKQLINFISGGLAGTSAGLLMMPLEVIKMQRQSSAIGVKSGIKDICKKVFRESGLRGFYKGALPTMIGVLPARGLYFWGYQTSKEYHKSHLGDTAANHLVSAFTAGFISNTAINPVWMVKTRYQLLGDAKLGQKNYQSYGDVIRSIYKLEGIRGFYKGLFASYLGSVEGAIQWIIYERLKTTLENQYVERSIIDSSSNNSSGGGINKSLLSGYDYFFSAGIAKFVAICISYPHEVVRTRMREQSVNGEFKYKGLFNTFRRIGAEEGIKGLYSGMWIHMVRSVPNSAIMFVAFELISKWLN
jgi:solute carrier family 25 protein 33/36